VKVWAEKYSIPLLQPEKIRDCVEEVKALQGDILVTCAYGQILTQAVLDIFPMGVWNIHAGLLPAYRGASPIQSCILNGESETGVCVMKTELGLDCGDILLVEKTEITETETYGELSDRLSLIGAELIVKALQGLQEGTITPQVQDDALSCYAGMITKDMSALDFTKPALTLHRTICALSGFTTLDGKRFKVFRSQVHDGTGQAQPGTLLDAQQLLVQCGEGTVLRLTEVQIEGGKRLAASDFIRGKKLTAGQKFGE
jgi:methionyl-tRNA formyltransferase